MRFPSTRSLAALALSASLLGAADYDYSLRPTLDTVVLGYYSAETKPVLTIKSGERVKIDTISLFGIPDDPEPFFRGRERRRRNEHALDQVIDLHQIYVGKPH